MCIHFYFCFFDKIAVYLKRWIVTAFFFSKSQFKFFQELRSNFSKLNVSNYFSLFIKKNLLQFAFMIYQIRYSAFLFSRTCCIPPLLTISFYEEKIKQVLILRVNMSASHGRKIPFCCMRCIFYAWFCFFIYSKIFKPPTCFFFFLYIFLYWLVTFNFFKLIFLSC